MVENVSNQGCLVICRGPKSQLNSASSAVVFYILLKYCCVPLSQDFKTERRYLSCDKNVKKYYTALQNSEFIVIKNV